MSDGQHGTPTESVLLFNLHCLVPSGQVCDNRAHEPIGTASRLREMGLYAATGRARAFTLISDPPTWGILSKGPSASAVNMEARFQARKVRNRRQASELSIVTVDLRDCNGTCICCKSSTDKQTDRN